MTSLLADKGPFIYCILAELIRVTHFPNCWDFKLLGSHV